MTFEFTTKNVILIVLGIVILGAFIPQTGSGFWNTITGNIVATIAQPIFDGISEQAVSTFQCIDEATGSVAGYSAFDAQIGKLNCDDVQ